VAAGEASALPGFLSEDDDPASDAEAAEPYPAAIAAD
jgi:hypothetical protein